jgi:ABC-2 type transport system ATP-binding protein
LLEPTADWIMERMADTGSSGAVSGLVDADTRVSGIPSVSVDVVTRTFGTRTALNNVSLAVGYGEVHALLGPNGAGKTTLIRLLSGALAPTSGSVMVCGVDAGRGSTELKRLVGVVPAGDRSLYLRISALENLAFFGRLQGLKRSAARAEAARALEQVGLAEHMDRPVNAYSHGMQKRVSFARALLTHPRVLLVDEATHDLDPEGADRVRRLAAEVASRGTAVLWATQRLEEIRDFATTVTLLDQGVVGFAGPVSALSALAASRRYVLELRNGNHSVSALNDVLAGHGRIERVSADEYVLAVDGVSTLGKVISTIEQAGVPVVDCREERSRLEGAFLEITSREGQ